MGNCFNPGDTSEEKHPSPAQSSVSKSTDFIISVKGLDAEQEIVGRGAIASPIGLKSMLKNTFLALLNLIFALKTKITSPNWHWR